MAKKGLDTTFVQKYDFSVSNSLVKYQFFLWVPWGLHNLFLQTQDPEENISMSMIIFS
jgi:hypothetical protein